MIYFAKLLRNFLWYGLYFYYLLPPGEQNGHFGIKLKRAVVAHWGAARFELQRGCNKMCWVGTHKDVKFQITYNSATDNHDQCVPYDQMWRLVPYWNMYLMGMRSSRGNRLKSILLVSLTSLKHIEYGSRNMRTVCFALFLCGPLRWRHNDHAGVSNHQPHGCLLNRLFRRKSKKTSKFRVTGLCAGNSPGTGEFPAQMASYAENVSIWWRHHASTRSDSCDPVIHSFPSGFTGTETIVWLS